MTERLQRCIDADGVVDLFPLLSDWSQGELAALAADIEAYHAEEMMRLSAVYHEHVFTVENFFTPERAAAIDQAYMKSQQDLMVVCSEIASVTLYYLKPAPIESLNSDLEEDPCS